jgi:hypothetical protein
MPLTKDEIAHEEAAIRALEQSARERWCKLKGHQWDLPNPNPFNGGPDFYACPIRCNRCGIVGTCTVTLAPPSAPPPAAAPASKK